MKASDSGETELTMHSTAGTSAARRRCRARLTIIAIFVVCAAPIVAAFFAYFVVKPHGGQTNYGELIAPQRPIPADLQVLDEAGRPIALAAFKGKWLMVSADSGTCDKACVTKLYYMRQIRTLQGEQRARVLPVWLVTDDAPIQPKIRTAYAQTRMLRADPAALRAWLPASADTSLRDHIYLVDPVGHLMMMFPKNPDPVKINQDLVKLLKWSSVG